MPLHSRVPQPSLFPRGYRFRLVAMLSALILIGLTIYNLRQRALLANAGQGHQGKLPAREKESPPDADEKTEWTETVVPGLADDDPLEMEEAQKQFEAIDDGENLQNTDMPAYWRLMRWARSRSFSELEERAERDVPFVKLWKEPASYRGKLVRLRVHVRRIVDWDQKGKNSAEVKKVYEIWGTTDESKSNPYSLAVFELPPQIPAKADASSEAVFVGYFLKVLKYSAEDKKERGAPLLVGRVKAVSGKSLATQREESLMAMLVIGGVILTLALIIVWFWVLTRKKRGTAASLAVPSLPNTEVEDWLQNPGEESGPFPSEPAGSSSIKTNGQAKHAVGTDSADANDHLE
jgi:hypothetical protein